MPMSNSQEENLAYVKGFVESALDKKYRAGAVEHSGDLLDLSPLELVNSAFDEAVDQVVYLATLRRIILANLCGQHPKV